MVNSIIKKLFEDGLASRIAESEVAEGDKQGTLRGGNSGIYIAESDTVAGSCHRIAHLRSLGINLDKQGMADRELMFSAGRMNEDGWFEALSRTWDGPILREEEVSTYWETTNGTKVTGRPDLVLVDKNTEQPVVGIELKLVSSLWTARDVLFEGKPKFPHLVQAAHYSWQLGVPFELWYTSRADFATNYIANRVLPKYKSKNWYRISKYLDFRYYRKVISRNGNAYGKQIPKDEFLKAEAAGEYGYKEGQVYVSPLKILPFATGYVLNWDTDTGMLTYTSTEEGAETMSTMISRDRIQEYYERISKISDSEWLGPRPLTLKGDGEKANYSICGYCPLKDTCDKYEKEGYKTWLSEVKRLAKKQK